MHHIATEEFLKEEIRKGQIDKVIQLIKGYLKEYDVNEYVYFYTLLGEAYLQLGKYPSALNYLYEALKIAKANKDVICETKVYILLGVLNIYIEDKQQAIQLFQQAVELSKEYGMGDLLEKSYNNLAAVYGELEEYEKCFEYCEKVLEMNKKQGTYEENIVVCSTLINIGESYIRLGKGEESRRYFEECINLAKKLNSLGHYAGCCFNLSIIFREQGDYEKAIPLIEEALELYISLEKQREEMECYKELSHLYEAIGDYKQAYIFLKCYVDIYQTVLNEKTRHQMRGMSVFYTKDKSGEV